MDDFSRSLKNSLKDEAFRKAWIDAGQEYRRQRKDLIREAVEASEAQIADGKGADARQGLAALREKDGIFHDLEDYPKKVNESMADQGSLEKFRAVLAKVPKTEPREEDRLP